MQERMDNFWLWKMLKSSYLSVERETSSSLSRFSRELMFFPQCEFEDIYLFVNKMPSKSQKNEIKFRMNEEKLNNK